MGTLAAEGYRRCMSVLLRLTALHQPWLLSVDGDVVDVGVVAHAVVCRAEIEAQQRHEWLNTVESRVQTAAAIGYFLDSEAATEPAEQLFVDQVRLAAHGRQA